MDQNLKLATAIFGVVAEWKIGIWFLAGWGWIATELELKLNYNEAWLGLYDLNDIIRVIRKRPRHFFRDILQVSEEVNGPELL